MSASQDLSGRNPGPSGPGGCQDEFDAGESGTLRDEALVEYLGPDHGVTWNDKAKEFLPYGDPMLRYLVCPEYSDEPRRPRYLILVRQS